MPRSLRKRVTAAALLTLQAVAPLFAQINTDRMLMVGRNALYYEDYVLSIRYFNQVITAKPFLAEPYFYRAVAKLSLEDFVGAEQDCSLSIERNPFVQNSYQVRGLARINQGKYAQAIDDYRRGLKLDPENVSLWHNYILSLMRDERVEEAQLAIDSLLECSSSYSPAMSMRSSILFEQADSAGAMQWMDKALEHDRHNADLYHQRGILKARMDRFKEAEADMDRAIYYDSSVSGYYFNRAMVRYYLDNLRGALSDYDLSIRVDSANTMAFYNRGILRAEVGDDNRAILDFDVVIDREPHNFMAIFNRAHLRSLTGDHAGSERDYTLVLDRYPDFTDGYLLRSRERYATGDRRGAEADELVVIKSRNKFGTVTGADTVSSSKSRSERDGNLRNYKKIVVSDDLENGTGYVSEFRGKVQNRNIDVKFLEQFYLTFFPQNSDGVKPQYSEEVDNLSFMGGFPGRLHLSNSNGSLTQEQIGALFAHMDRQTALIAEEPENPYNLLSRAIDYMLLQDYSLAEADLNRAAEGGEHIWSIFFCRSLLTMRRIAMTQAELKADIQFSGPAGSSLRKVQEQEYQSALNDLTVVLQLLPDFSIAYYNRGIIEAAVSDYHAACADFSHAVKLNPEFAEAYYNRGIVLVMLNRRDEAVSDLSRAGELGLYQAYNIIKRVSE